MMERMRNPQQSSDTGGRHELIPQPESSRVAAIRSDPYGSSDQPYGIRFAAMYEEAMGPLPTLSECDYDEVWMPEALEDGQQDARHDTFAENPTSSYSFRNKGDDGNELCEGVPSY